MVHHAKPINSIYVDGVSPRKSEIRTFAHEVDEAIDDQGQTLGTEIEKLKSSILAQPGTSIFASVAAAQADADLPNGAYYYIISEHSGGALDLYIKNSGVSSTFQSTIPSLSALSTVLPIIDFRFFNAEADDDGFDNVEAWEAAAAVAYDAPFVLWIPASANPFGFSSDHIVQPEGMKLAGPGTLKMFDGKTITFNDDVLGGTLCIEADDTVYPEGDSNYALGVVGQAGVKLDFGRVTDIHGNAIYVDNLENVTVLVDYAENVVGQVIIAWRGVSGFDFGVRVARNCATDGGNVKVISVSAYIGGVGYPITGGTVRDGTFYASATIGVEIWAAGTVPYLITQINVGNITCYDLGGADTGNYIGALSFDGCARCTYGVVKMIASDPGTVPCAVENADCQDVQGQLAYGENVGYVLWVDGQTEKCDRNGCDTVQSLNAEKFAYTVGTNTVIGRLAGQCTGIGLETNGGDLTCLNLGGAFSLMDTGGTVMNATTGTMRVAGQFGSSAAANGVWGYAGINATLVDAGVSCTDADGNYTLYVSAVPSGKVLSKFGTTDLDLCQNSLHSVPNQPTTIGAPFNVHKKFLKRFGTATKIRFTYQDTASGHAHVVGPMLVKAHWHGRNSGTDYPMGGQFSFAWGSFGQVNRPPVPWTTKQVDGSTDAVSFSNGTDGGGKPYVEITFEDSDAGGMCYFEYIGGNQVGDILVSTS